LRLLKGLPLLSLMVSRKIGCLPVMSSDGLEGMLTTTDLLRHQLYTAFERTAEPAKAEVRR
jgi:CBS domain-containing protein